MAGSLRRGELGHFPGVKSSVPAPSCLPDIWPEAVALTVAWQLCLRQAAEPAAGFGEAPAASRGPNSADADAVRGV